MDLKSSTLEKSDSGNQRNASVEKAEIVVACRDDIDEYERQNVEYYRTTGNIEAYFLMLLDYTSVSLMNFPWVFSQLGFVIGMFLIIIFAILSYYGGLFIFLVCRRFEKIKDFCMYTQKVTGSRIGYEFAFVCFVLNNLFIIGLHIQQNTIVLNTLTDHGMCTAVFAVIATTVSLVFNIPRTFSKLTLWSAIATVSFLVGLVLTISFSSKAHNIAGYAESGVAPTMSAKPIFGRSASFYFSTALNLVLMPFGQVFYPSFIYEMKNPKKFKNCLRFVLIYQLCVYIPIAFILCHYMGQYSVAPAMSTLKGAAKKITYPFILPTSLFVATLYVSATSKVLFHRLARKSRHYHSNTVVGWSSWLGIVVLIWFLGCFVCLAFPSFSLLVSIASALFSPTFGIILPAIGYLYLRKIDKKDGKTTSSLLFSIAILSLVIGMVIVVFGLYSSIDEIIIASRDGISQPFSCKDNST